ncbi:hypothetical protein BD410DRAFT_761047 [Rickenella mellea]|uniref:Uncharacterized protein n=1 Tax=Rickenella mellea TaxID=50990 RepID=A0A4Y7QKV5_9AGAM|nr:hypothetical protein BD410DRAFT_761047 [Rickenella mellea]
MNKLRKRSSSKTTASTSSIPISISPSSSPSVSRTLSIALKEPAHLNHPTKPIRPLPAIVQPRSPGETYWAVRALTAETLLAARREHYTELHELSRSEDVRRARELAAAKAASDVWHSKLEKIICSLLVTIISFSLAVTYLSISNSSRHPPQISRWSLPSHFTIPILSPFTSVTEHESSVVGFRVMAVGVVVLGLLAYALIRHWMSTARR